MPSDDEQRGGNRQHKFPQVPHFRSRTYEYEGDLLLQHCDFMVLGKVVSIHFRFLNFIFILFQKKKIIMIFNLIPGDVSDEVRDIGAAVSQRFSLFCVKRVHRLCLFFSRLSSSEMCSYFI